MHTFIPAVATRHVFAFAAVFTAGFERLLLLRGNQRLGFLASLLANVVDFFALLLGSEGTIGADGLDLRMGTFLELLALLHG